jgi:hypothetical protein
MVRALGLEPRTNALKEGISGLLQGLHGCGEAYKSPMVTMVSCDVDLARVCMGFHPFISPLVPAESPEFEVLD